MEWDSPWGRGFPGWHIECSAMSTRYLGALFDIHIGGEDHVPVHHSNEIAQHEACHGHPPARYWLHGAFLRLQDSDKMSKSDGSFIRLDSLVERGFDPLAYRYLALTAHYRSKLVFSWTALEAAQTALGRLRLAYHGLPSGGMPDPAYRERMLAELNEDLNTPRALALAWEVLKSDLPGDVQKATLGWLDQVLGLGLDTWRPETHAVPDAVLALVSQRAKIAGLSGLFGNDKLLDYSATKGAIHALTKSLATNLAPRGIRVNAVAPGPVWTPLNPADQSPDKIAQFGTTTDMKRPAQPEEISPAYVFLASPVCSAYITGIVLPVMGGVTGSSG